MVFMIETKYANEDLEIELTSYIDSKQNVWFRGKDIATILGYSNGFMLIVRINSKYSLPISAYPKWIRWLLVAVYVHVSMNLAFTLWYYLLNWNLRKSSNIG